MEKQERIFRQKEQYNFRAFSICMKWTVVPLWNQMEQFYPLVILGNKPRISPRSMVRECDEEKWLWYSGHFDKNEKRGLHLKFFLFFPRKLSGGKGLVDLLWRSVFPFKRKSTRYFLSWCTRIKDGAFFVTAHTFCASRGTRVLWVVASNTGIFFWKSTT